jgi:hypothetical protein
VVKSVENSFCPIEEEKEAPTVTAESFCKKDRRENPFILFMYLIKVVEDQRYNGLIPKILLYKKSLELNEN